MSLADPTKEPKPRTVSDRGLAFIRQHEELRTAAYLDPVSIPTIGYGHTKGVRLGQSITAETAEELLRLDLLPMEAVLDQKFPELSQTEFDALASFIFNVGLGAFLRSTLRKCLDAGDRDGATAQFKRWDKATKPDGTVITLKGLTRRREAEARLFWAGDYGKAWS